jgi:hypothetical protein
VKNLKNHQVSGMFVKDFAQENNIPYKEALKAAGPHYRKLKGSGYSRVN